MKTLTAMLFMLAVLHGAAPVQAEIQWGTLRSEDGKTPVLLFKDRAATETFMQLVRTGEHTNQFRVLPLVAADVVTGRPCLVPSGTKAGLAFKPSPKDATDPFIFVVVEGLSCSGLAARLFYHPPAVK